MKALITLLATCTLTAHATDVFHAFTAADGRTLKAKVISYDSNTGRVKIKRDDGTRLRIKIGAFSSEDQIYIQQWEAVSLFMSETSVPVTLSQIEDRKWKSTRESAQRGGMGNNGSNNSRPSGPGGPGGGGGDEGGGQSGGPGGDDGGPNGGGAQVVATDKYVRYHYQIKLSNRTSVELNDLAVNYRIFYEQDRAVPEDSSHAPKQSQGIEGMDEQEKGFFHAERQRLEATGEVKVETLASNARKMIPTVGVSILNRNAKSGAEGDMIDLEGEIKGIWVKVSMKAPDGTLRTREVALPRRIFQNHDWRVYKSNETSDGRRG